MKQAITLLLSFLLVLTLGACSHQQQASSEVVPDTEEQQEESGDSQLNTPLKETEPDDSSDNRVLIVYYSYSGVTEDIAVRLQEKTGGDIFELMPVEAYPDDMYEASDRAEEELGSGTLPELSGELPDVADYDTVLIGGPVWSEQAAPPIVSYLSQTALEGKVVAPFWTYNNNEGAYEEHVVSYINNGDIKEGLGLSSPKSMEESELEQLLDQWLERVLTNAEQIGDLSTVETPIVISIGDEIIQAVLNDSAAAKEFREMLPVTVSMIRMGEHEYYGSLPAPLTHTEDLQTGYTVGDLAFWTPGDLFALYFDEPETPPEGLMILGRITSDLSVFDRLRNSEEVRIEVAE